MRRRWMTLAPIVCCCALALAEEPAPHGDILNQGAYGGTAHASKSTRN